MHRKIGAALVILIASGSCTNDFIIEPSGSGTAIELSFYQPGHVWRGGVGLRGYPTKPCITKLTVVEANSVSARRGRVIWQISEWAGCVKLGEVKIGKVPGGFDETVPYVPLRTGQMYRATARSRETVGASKPWIVCPDAPRIVLSNDDYWLVKSPRDCNR